MRAVLVLLVIVVPFSYSQDKKASKDEAEIKQLTASDEFLLKRLGKQVLDDDLSHRSRNVRS